MKNGLIFLFCSLLFTACIKDPLAPANNSTAAPATPNACPTADGALWAVQSISERDNPIGGTFSITIGLGVGVFSSNGTLGSSTNRVNVGTVKLNGTDAEYIGETYVTQPGINNPNGVDFNNGVTWEISGDNGFGAFTHTPTNAFPTASEITSGTTVTKADGYTLTCATVTGADAVLFLVGDVEKIVTGNTTSCTFSASELSSLDNGESLVQIVPYTTSSANVGGKNICFGKEMVQQLSVTIQ